MLSVLLVIPNRQMPLAKAERSSQFDKINARRVCKRIWRETANIKGHLGGSVET